MQVTFDSHRFRTNRSEMGAVLERAEITTDDELAYLQEACEETEYSNSEHRFNANHLLWRMASVHVTGDSQLLSVDKAHVLFEGARPRRDLPVSIESFVRGQQSLFPK